MREGIDMPTLVESGEIPLYDKYDAYIPAELLRRAFLEDRLAPDEVVYRFTKGFGESL